MSGFKIVCGNCGESCKVEDHAEIGRQGDTSIELKHDANVYTNGVTEFFFEISCESCGNSFKMSL